MWDHAVARHPLFQPHPAPSTQYDIFLSRDAPSLLPQEPLTLPSLLGGKRRRSGRLSGSKRTASSCSCSRRPSKKPSTSPSKPTPSASTTPLSSPSRTSSLGLTTPPRSPASPPLPPLANKAGTRWWHVHLLLAGLSPAEHVASLVGRVASLFVPGEGWHPTVLWSHMHPMRLARETLHEDQKEGKPPQKLSPPVGLLEQRWCLTSPQPFCSLESLRCRP